jgi:hypothetical protein
VTFPLARNCETKYLKLCFPKHDFQNHFTKAFPCPFVKLSPPTSLGFRVVARDLIGSGLIITLGAATKLGAPCVMHPHGRRRAYVGIEVRDCDRFQMVPAYNTNPKLSFSKTLLKKQQVEKSCISNKRCFGFQKSLLKKNIALFYLKFSKLKVLRNKLLSWRKKRTAFKKNNRILKSFAPFKTFGLFQIF